MKKVLVAGVGNVFHGDDAFGVEVARKLGEKAWPDSVRVRDFGIRGLHLAYELLDGWDLLIVIDAVATGAPAGTVHVIAPELDSTSGAADAHGMDLRAVFATTRSLGGKVPRVLLVGCDVAEVSERMGLTDVVAAAIEPAARKVEEIVKEARA